MIGDNKIGRDVFLGEVDRFEAVVGEERELIGSANCLRFLGIKP